jgi:PAS domain S-box-containing protein
MHKRRLAGENVPTTYEIGVVKSDGSKVEHEVSFVTIPNTNPVQIMTLSKDISERKQMEEELRNSEALYRKSSNLLHSVMESSAEVTIFALDKEYKYLTFNELHHNFYKNKYGIDVAKGKSFIELVPDKDFAKEAQNSWDRALSGESFSIVSEEGLVVNGVEKIEYWNNYVSPIFNDTKEITGLTCFSINITKRREIEKKLAESHSFLNHLVDSIPDPIFVKDREHRWIILNKANCELTGLSKDYLIGKSDYDIFPKEEADIFWEKDEVVFNSKKVNTNEEFFTSSDGVVHCIETVKSMFVASDGKEYLVGTIRDITERKNAEDAVKALNETLEKRVADRTSELQKALDFNNGIINAIPDLMFEVDTEGIYLNVWAKNEELLAAQKEILLGKKLSDILSTEATIVAMEAIAEADEKGLSFGKTLKIDLPDGIHWFELSSSKKADGNIIFISRDITERKLTEQNLLLKEFALNTISEGIFLIDINSNFHYVNESVCKSLGYSEEELMNIGVVDIDPNISREIWKQHWEDIKKNKTTLILSEHKRKDGTIFPIEVSSNYFEYNGVGYSLAVSRDVTERQKAEREIKEREEKFSKLFMSSPAAVSVTSIDRGVYLEVNESFLYFTKYTREEVVGKSSADLQLFANPDERAEFFRRVLEDGIVRGYEFQYRAKDGTTGYGVAYATLLTIQGERCILAHSYDINATKQLELLNTAINNTSEAVYITDDAFSIIYVNDGACKMLGFTKEELTSMKVYEIDALCSLESLSALQQEKQLKKNIVFETKHRMKNGNIIDVEITGSYFRFHNKTVFLSVANDITQKIKYKRQIEELNRTLEAKVVERTKELQKALEFNSSIIQAIPDMLFEISKEGVYLNIWARDIKLLAVQKETLLGKNLKDILPPEALEISLKTMKEVDMFGSSLGNTYKLDLPDGEHWFELHTTKKEPEGSYLALVRDVTERTKAQKTLLELNRTLEEKVQEGLKKPTTTLL